MIISFSGTRHGMTSYQLKMLEDYLRQHRSEISRAKHGMCIGADAEFHWLVRKVCGSLCYIEGLPSNVPGTSLAGKLDVDFEHPQEGPLIRNCKIVDGSKILLAAPKTNLEVMRSGTWHAVRYARRQGVPVLQLLTDEVKLG